MSGIKRTTTNRSKQNEFNIKGITYADAGDLTTIDNSLNVVGDVSFNSSLSVGGKITLQGDVSLNAFVSVARGLNVVGPTTTTTLVASGDVDFQSDVDVAGRVDVTGDVSLNAFVSVASGLNVVGPTTTTTLVASGDADFQSDVDVTGRVDVTGDVSLNAFVSVASGLNVVGPTTTTTLVASSDVSFETNAYVGGKLVVIDNVSLNNSLYVEGPSRFVGLVTIDGSLNVSESSFTYTKTTVNSVNLDVSDNIIKINVKDISSNQTTNLPSGIMVQDASTNIFFGYSGRKDGQEHSDKFIITKTTYDEALQSDISLALDTSIDVFMNGSLEVSGNVVINGSLQSSSMVGFAYQAVGETNDLSSGEYPFAFGAGAYDQDEYFGYPILIQSKLVKVGLMLSDASMDTYDASINDVVFDINGTSVTFNWEDLSGYCTKSTKLYPTKDVDIAFSEGSMVNVECTSLTLNNFPVRYDVVGVEKARIIMKFLTT